MWSPLSHPRQALGTDSGGLAKHLAFPHEERLYWSYSNCIPRVLHSGSGSRVYKSWGHCPGSSSINIPSGVVQQEPGIDVQSRCQETNEIVIGWLLSWPYLNLRLGWPNPVRVGFGAIIWVHVVDCSRGVNPRTQLERQSMAGYFTTLFWRNLTKN